MKKLVVLSGAGVSAESGLKTFRDSDGLWENYNVYDVATPEAWEKDYEMVLEFYNARRNQVRNAIPNEAHILLAKMEEKFNVHIITQNIDDLHERAGSKNVLHLHGEIKKARSTKDKSILIDLDNKDIYPGDNCVLGSQLRPHVVWFGEAVPAIPEAEKIMKTADMVLIVGTSMNVYPAAGLIHAVPSFAPVYVVDPKEVQVPYLPNTLYSIQENATLGIKKLYDDWMGR